jgi:Ser-tRNA(Ala) deacylase AlaX
MTKKLFWQDPYQTELDTMIKTVSGNQITVNETIFYAASGGQESDHGTFNGYPVISAEKQGQEIIYTLPENHTLKPGDKVTIIIDWERRYNLMRLHFAAEIVLELLYQNFPKIIKTGAHIAAQKARIDVQWEESIAPHLSFIQQQAQAIVDANQKIISDFSDIQAERRYWKINEFSQVPCGGTHIKHTGEIGRLQLKRVNIGKGKERIEIYAYA